MQSEKDSDGENNGKNRGGNSGKDSVDGIAKEGKSKKKRKDETARSTDLINQKEKKEHAGKERKV
jgi:hypothetical protein